MRAGDERVPAWPMERETSRRVRLSLEALQEVENEFYVRKRDVTDHRQAEY